MSVTQFSAADLHHWPACRRIVWYRTELVVPAADDGPSGNESEVSPALRQRAEEVLARLGMPAATVHFRRRLGSPRSMLWGRPDVLVVTGEETVPVELPPPAPTSDLRLLLAFDRMLVAGTDLPAVRRGFVATGFGRVLAERRVTARDERRAEAILAKAAAMVSLGDYPPPTDEHLICLRCEFAVLCPDVH